MFDIIASIVLFKNDENILTQAINSFLSTKLNIKLILIDNSPSDCLKLIASKYDNRVEYIHNSSNLGFGAAHNIGIQKYVNKTKYYLVLNPDIFFDEGVLENIFSFMESNIDIGHLLPKVLYPDGSMQFLCKLNPTVFDLFARRFLPTPFQRLFKNRMERYEYKDRNLNEIIYNVPYLSGCFMFLRSSSLIEVGYFEEKIFMYIEDADLTRRFLQKAKTVYYPYSTVYHYFAKGSHKSWKLTWYSIHGAFIYFNKWGWKLF